MMFCDNSLLYSAGLTHQESFAEVATRLLRDLLGQLGWEEQTLFLTDSSQDITNLANRKTYCWLLKCCHHSNMLLHYLNHIISDLPLLCWAGELWWPGNGSELAQWLWRWRSSTRWGGTCSCTFPSCGAKHAGRPLWVCPPLLATQLRDKRSELGFIMSGYSCSPLVTVDVKNR